MVFQKCPKCKNRSREAEICEVCDGTGEVNDIQKYNDSTGEYEAVRVGQIWIDTETDEQFRITSRVDGDTVKIEGQSCGIIDRDELNDMDRYEFVEYAGDR